MLHTTTTTTAAAANASWFTTDSPSVAARRSFVVKGRNLAKPETVVRSRRSLENGSVPFTDANAFTAVVEKARESRNGKGASRGTDENYEASSYTLSNK